MKFLAIILVIVAMATAYPEREPRSVLPLLPSATIIGAKAPIVAAAPIISTPLLAKPAIIAAPALPLISKGIW